MTESHKKEIASSYQKWLAILVLIAFVIATLFLWITQTKLSEKSVIDLMKLNMLDVKQDIVDASDRNLLELTKIITNELDFTPEIDNETLEMLKRRYEVAEINVIDKNGIITHSTHDDFINYDMASGSQSAEFLQILDGEDHLVQKYQPTTYDPGLWRKYAAADLKRKDGFVQVGYDAKMFREDIDSVVVGITRNRHVGTNGSIIIADSDSYILSSRNGSEGKTLESIGVTIDRSKTPAGEIFLANVYGVSSYCVYQNVEGYCAVAVIPQEEAVLSRNVSVGATLGVELVVFAALFVMVSVLTKKLIVRNLQRINNKLTEITNGNLDAVVDVRSHIEFSKLSDDINTTVNTLKRYIQDAEARIDAELEFAKTIQAASLPSVFPPYPNRREFDIWASMDPAKEVGGDFYDFYFVNDNTLAFLIADVSGKGIPAAMFMMSSKSVIKSFAEAGREIQDIFIESNNDFCSGNDTGMFLTAWLGFLNIDTGVLKMVNAGHCPPVIRRANGKFEYLKVRSGMPLAVMEGLKYRPYEIQLSAGDEIFLYTDGVTEACSSDEQFYGEDRLLDVLNRNIDVQADSLCKAVKEDIDKFVGEAEQFDDITMLSFKYNGAPAPDVITLEADIKNIDIATEFVTERLEAAECPMKIQTQVCVCIDEIFSNIANYAYGDEKGDVTIKLLVKKEPAMMQLTFVDSGSPFNPLLAKEPDTTLGIEERGIGGLGIHLVKKMMTNVSYSHIDGRNILVMEKAF